MKTLKIVLGALFLLSLVTVSAFAFPSIQPQYTKEYNVIRDQTNSSELELLQIAYKDRDKNDFLREISHPQPTEMEFYLADQMSGYGFFSPEKSLESLEKLIEEHQTKAMNIAEKELILGDAYHWLGHVYEEKGELTKAYEAYIRSHVHYQKTPLQRSPRINPMLIVQEHGLFHLGDIQSTIRSFANLPGFQLEICASFFN